MIGAFASTIITQKYAHSPAETWGMIAKRVAREVVARYLPNLADTIEPRIAARKVMPAGRILYGAGRPFHQTNNCFLFRATDSREGWGDLMRRATTSLMTGGGVGVVYSDLRGEGVAVSGMGGVSSGPLALMEMVNSMGREVNKGGPRRAALWAGLHWSHPDIFKFIHCKDWPEYIVAHKLVDYDTPAPMDRTNISVILDTAWFKAYHDPLHRDHALAQLVYWETCKQACSTAEPGFSIDADENEGENLRNACTEVTSRLDNDVCNLASIVMPRCRHIAEFRDSIHDTVGFLLCNTLYSKLPIPEMDAVRAATRRIGLGLMGVHEWLMQRSLPYGPCSELEKWMQAYAEQTEASARYWARVLGVNTPIKTRAIAPNGTISLVAETTSGCEPLFAAAILRRYLRNGEWVERPVVDPVAKRMIALGVNPDSIEDAHSVDTATRLAMQVMLQKYVDHGISSTINLPAKSDGKVFGALLLPHLAHLRGVTVYPDGARAGQPLTRMPLADAMKADGVESKPSYQSCSSGVCGE